MNNYFSKKDFVLNRLENDYANDQKLLIVNNIKNIKQLQKVRQMTKTANKQSYT